MKAYSHLDWQQECRKISSLGLKHSFLFCRLISQQVCFYDLSFETAFPSVIYLYALIIYQHLIQFPPQNSEQKNIVERLIDKMVFELCLPTLPKLPKLPKLPILSAVVIFIITNDDDNYKLTQKSITVPSQPQGYSSNISSFRVIQRGNSYV